MLKSPVNVLIVDDEASICSLIKAEFSGRGFNCCTATEPALALQLLETQPYQLLISDIMMPGMSGLELLAHVKRHAPSCKVVLMTAASNREFLAQAIMLGAYDYVEKPFDIEDLFTVALKATSGDSERPQLLQRAAAAMELSSQAKQASLDSVRALVRAVEAKDPYTRRHCEQVASYAVSLARALKLSETTVESIRVASLLHDIGKIGVPDHILTKPGPLTPEEYQHIQRHAALGRTSWRMSPCSAKRPRWSATITSDGTAGDILTA